MSGYYMGIDGGGSTLRIVIADTGLNSVETLQSTSANPNIIGHDVASKHIRDAITKIMAQASLKSSDIMAVGIGIAGASNTHSEDWLRETLSPVLTDTLIVPSSDLEIALVGALGQRHGILVLSGTGSAAYGVSPEGQKLQLGGWGYLLGDEGSGYWIGLQAFRRIIRDSEIHYNEFVQFSISSLNRKILNHLNLHNARDLIAWLYRTDKPPVTRVASITHLIMDEASQHNWDAINLLQSASIHLADKVDLMSRRLHYSNAPIAFSGGLLDNDNRLSRELTARLNLPARPIAKYPPVIGGAILAKLEWESSSP